MCWVVEWGGGGGGGGLGGGGGADKEVIKDKVWCWTFA